MSLQGKFPPPRTTLSLRDSIYGAEAISSPSTGED